MWPFWEMTEKQEQSYSEQVVKERKYLKQASKIGNRNMTWSITKQRSKRHQ